MQIGSFVISVASAYFIFMKLGDQVSQRWLYFAIAALYVAGRSVWLLPAQYTPCF